MPAPSSPPDIGPWSDPPQRGVDVGEAFRTKADTWVAQLPTRSDEMAAVAEWVETTAAGVYADASAAADASADAASAKTAAELAADAAEAAKDAAEAASGLAAGHVATSTTSLSIGLGSKVFAIGIGKGFVVGEFVTAAATATPTAKWMHGQVTDYSSGDLTVSVDATNGSGTVAAWTLSVAGPRGPEFSGTLTAALNMATPVTLASGSTVNIGAANSNLVNVTGTTTITAFDTIADGAERELTFAGALTLTHNATSLILPGAANITTAAGDVAVMRSLGAGNWRCVGYTRADGTAVMSGGWLTGMAAKTANYTVATADRAKLIRATGSNSWTLTLPDAATFGLGGFRWQNAGSGVVTIARTGSNTIDGTTGYASLPGEVRDFQSDGANWFSTIVSPFYMVFTSGGTFPALAPGYVEVEGEAWGSGLGGRYIPSSGDGGSGAARLPFREPAASFSSPQTVTIAAAAAGTSSTTPNNGSNTSLGSLVTAYGPTASDIVSLPGKVVGTGALPTGLDGFMAIDMGGYATAAGSYNVNTLYGGAGSRAISSGTPSGAADGVSKFAGNAGATVASGTGGNGSAPGGGGGNTNNGTGGNSGRGELRIWGVAG